MKRLSYPLSFFIFALTATAQEKIPRAIPLAKAADAPKISDKQVGNIRFQGISFDSRSHRLAVADQAKGPASQYTGSAAAGRAFGGIAAVNAGFFTPTGAPLGLVISNGKSAGGWNGASSLGAGIWYQKSSGAAGISRREKLGKTAASKMQELLQAGPMLVEDGKRIGGLEAQKTGTRTFIAWDGNTRWWIGCCSSCTLAELSQSLSGTNLTGWPIKHALNFDGGSSSDLWISEKVPGGPVQYNNFWSKPVRNFLVLKPR